MADPSAPKMDGSRLVYGFTTQADINIGQGIVAQYGGEVTVANFTDDTFGGYNFVCPGWHVAGSTSTQATTSGTMGASIFIGYNDSTTPIKKGCFAGKTYTSNICAEFYSYWWRKPFRF